MKNFWLDRNNTQLKVKSFRFEINRLKDLIFDDIVSKATSSEMPSSWIRDVIAERLALEMEKYFAYYSFIRITNLRRLILYFQNYFKV